MKSIFFFLVLALCVNVIPAKALVNVQDSLALVDLYNSTDGPNWNNHTNWLTSSPVSTWSGIEVTNNRVIRISLNQNKLNGSIPSSLGNLVNLIYLFLSGNQLSGCIPSSLGNLVHLASLDLDANRLTGSIPSSLGNLVNLGSLHLAFNRLTGSIPPSLGNLVVLHDLDLSYNMLTGSIPSSFGNLKLSHLVLRNNQLSGSIPSFLGNLGGLRSLLLDGNRLSGSIPSSLGNLGNLRLLFLDNNQLSGSIPSSFSNLNPLGIISLTHNYFTFDGMELIAQTFGNGFYSKQHRIPIHQHGNTLSVSAGGTLSNNTYKWYRFRHAGDTIIIKGDSVFHPTQNGKYLVRVKNSIATELTLFSDSIVYIAPAIIASAENALQQNGKTILFRVYPNPTKDILHVETNGSVTFSLINQSGKILSTTNITGKGSINVSGITPGLYYLKNNSTQTVLKVVIAK